MTSINHHQIHIIFYIYYLLYVNSGFSDELVGGVANYSQLRQELANIGQMMS